MKKISCALLFVSAMLFGNAAYCQKTQDSKKAQIEHIAKELSITAANAEQVVVVMEDYKTKAKSALTNKSLSEAERRARLDLLIDEKNIHLTKILTPEQLQKFKPTSENR